MTNESQLKLVQIQLHNGIDLDSRSIYWGGGEEISAEAVDGTVCPELAEMAIRKLHILKSINDKPIHFYMSSTGGDEYSMYRLYDEFRLSTAPITFHAGGAIMSAAVGIMMACEQRFATLNTDFMVHQGYSSRPATDKPKDVIIEADYMDFLLEKMYSLYERHSYCPFEFWAKICHYNAYISAKEALTLGMIDGIETKEKLITKTKNPKEIEETMKAIIERVKMHKFNRTVMKKNK